MHVPILLHRGRRLVASPRHALLACALLAALAPATACTRAAPPAALAPRRPPAGGVEVPSRFADNQVLIQLSVGGSAPLWFLLDSGMPVTTVDSALVARLGLAPRDPVVLRDAGDRNLEARYHEGARVRVGGAVVEVPRVVPVDGARMGRLAGVPVAGLIGWDLLSHFTAEIDYHRETVRLYPAGGYEAPSGATVVPLTLESRAPYVEATVSPSASPTPVRLLLDLGASGGLDLFGPRVRASGIARAAASMRRILVGGLVGGVRPVRAGRLDAVQLGRIVLMRPPAWVAEDSVSTQDRPGRDGRLGGAVLRHFVVAVDYRARRMVLTPNALAGVRPAEAVVAEAVVADAETAEAAGPR